MEHRTTRIIKGETMNKIEQFTDDISAMSENAEEIMSLVYQTADSEHQAMISSYSLILKGQAVLGDMLLEVLKTQNRTP